MKVLWIIFVNVKLGLEVLIVVSWRSRLAPAVEFAFECCSHSARVYGGPDEDTVEHVNGEEKKVCDRNDKCDPLLTWNRRTPLDVFHLPIAFFVYFIFFASALDDNCASVIHTPHFSSRGPKKKKKIHAN